MSDVLTIPFGRAVRVGNYKLWRSRPVLAPNGGEGGLEQLNVSDLDGGWSVKIPQSSLMYATLMQAYATTDDETRDGFMGMVLTNMRNVCLISSPALHDAFFFLTEMMTFPYLLLPEDEMAERMRRGFSATGGGDVKKFEEHVAEMLGYRREVYSLIDKKKREFIEEYERQLAERRAQDAEAADEASEDEMAQQSLDILGT